MKDKTFCLLWSGKIKAVTILVEQRACQEAVGSSTSGTCLWARIFQGKKRVKMPSFYCFAKQIMTPDSIRALKASNFMYTVSILFQHQGT